MCLSRWVLHSLTRKSPPCWMTPGFGLAKGSSENWLILFFSKAQRGFFLPKWSVWDLPAVKPSRIYSTMYIFDAWQLHAQIYIYVYISDNGCCDSMSCFSMITSKEKVVIATTLFGYMCMRVILKMLGVTKVDTVVGQDGCLCKQRAQQWSEVGWCMFNNWLSLQKLPGFWKFLEGALTKCWLIVHVDFRSVNTPTTVNFKPPIWCQGTCRIPANLTICSCKSEHKPVYRSLKQVHASLILSLHTRVHTHSPTHTHSYTCIQEILFSLQKNVKLKMTYKNKSAGNKVSEMSPDEPSGLSRGKLQFDYFLLLHCSEATTQASFSKCISHQMFFFF